MEYVASLTDNLFRSNNDMPIDVTFNNASNANELAKLLCHLMCIGYDVLNDIPSVLKKMERIGVHVRFALLENMHQLMAENDNVDDLKNHKFLVVMGDGSKYVVTFGLYHHFTHTCHDRVVATIQQ